MSSFDPTLPCAPPVPLDWLAIFGRRAPVEIEIGAGKGRYILKAAAERPGHDFVGIEIRRKHAELCAQRARKHARTNVRLMRADAAAVLWSLTPSASVRAVHVYYPDPWWKARHKKRRIFTGQFVADIARALEPGGELRVATDVPDYFDVIVRTVEETGLFGRGAADVAEFGSRERPLTNFQEKAVRAGRGMEAAVFVRNGAAAPPTPDPRTRLSLAKKQRRSRPDPGGDAGPPA